MIKNKYILLLLDSLFNNLKHRWFTTDLENKMINVLGLTNNKDNKTWYSYKTNDKISQYFNT